MSNTSLSEPMRTTMLTSRRLVSLCHFESHSIANRTQILGLNFINRKLAKTASACFRVVKLNDTEYAFITEFFLITHVQKFIPGVEIEQTTPDGRKIKNIFTVEGNRLTEKQIEKNREVTLIRDFFETENVGIAYVGELTCNMWSKVV